MKCLVIFLIIAGIISISIPTYANGLCVSGADWDEVPCWGRTCYGSDTPACTDPNWWKERWIPYYDYKGAEWMESKKIELIQVIKDGTLEEWKAETPSQAHKNVHDYYFYMGEVPNIYGIYVDQFFAGSFPPLKQLKAGTKLDEIFCKDDFVLIQKYNGSPACVTYQTGVKLIDRGWGTCDDGITHYRGHPCGPHSSPGISSDLIIEPVNPNFDFSNVVDANNQFAIDFYSHVTADKDENVFFSPWSISTAFSILHEGTKENTAREIQQVFGFPEDDIERKHGYLSLHKAINEKSSEDVKLQIANALWLAQNFEPLPEYTDTATTYYDSTVSVVDFVSDDGVNQINDWVNEKTEEKIEKLLEPGSTGSATRMAITNAIYFKGLWEHPFDPKDTYEGDFIVNSEKTVKVPMMTYSHKMQINAAFTEQMKMLAMPYKNNTMSMLILLPNEIDGLKTIEDSLTLENLEGWKEMLSGNNRGIVIHIPKFSLETDYNLIQTLPEMGMPSAFNSIHADLSGITGYKGLYISQAIHKAFVDVNEIGTEAAAATAIVTNESGGQLFKADHPFIFIIQDNETGQILFIGKILDPTV